MIRITSSRRRYPGLRRRDYAMTRHPLLDRALRFIAWGIPLATAVYVLLVTIFDWITPLGALFSPGSDIIIRGDYGKAVRALDRAHIEHRFGQDTPDGGVIVKVSDEQKALQVLRREGIDAY